MESLLNCYNTTLTNYTPKGSLKTTEDPISTLATNSVRKYNLTVERVGDFATLDYGFTALYVPSIVLNSTSLYILQSRTYFSSDVISHRRSYFVSWPHDRLQK